MADPKPTFAHLVTQLRDHHSDLAYIHLIEDGVNGDGSADAGQVPEENDFLREIWGERRFLSAGGYTRELGIKYADEKGDLIVYGQPFIANVRFSIILECWKLEMLILDCRQPDLPFRLKRDIPLTISNRKTYYVLGSEDPTGYTDYPFSNEIREEGQLVEGWV